MRALGPLLPPILHLAFPVGFSFPKFERSSRLFVRFRTWSTWSAVISLRSLRLPQPARSALSFEVRAGPRRLRSFSSSEFTKSARRQRLPYLIAYVLVVSLIYPLIRRRALCVIRRFSLTAEHLATLHLCGLAPILIEICPHSFSSLSVWCPLLCSHVSLYCVRGWYEHESICVDTLNIDFLHHGGQLRMYFVPARSIVVYRSWDLLPPALPAEGRCEGESARQLPWLLARVHDFTSAPHRPSSRGAHLSLVSLIWCFPPALPSAPRRHSRWRVVSPHCPRPLPPRWLAGAAPPTGRAPDTSEMPVPALLAS